MGSRCRPFDPARRGAAAALALSLALGPLAPMPCAARSHGGHAAHPTAVPVSGEEGAEVPDAGAPCALAGSCREGDVIAASGRAPAPAEAGEAAEPESPDHRALLPPRPPEPPPPRA